MNLEIETPLRLIPLLLRTMTTCRRMQTGRFPSCSHARTSDSGWVPVPRCIRGLQASNSYDPYGYYKALWAPESGYIGDTIYPGLSTSGIGLNTTSYTQFQDSPQNSTFLPLILLIDLTLS
ncbi:hypothetical protein V1520DRAFT_117755 [Lipomyces starkeyi]